MYGSDYAVCGYVPLRFFLYLLPDEKVVICLGYKKKGWFMYQTTPL